MPEIKERPILFSGPMVRAILEGRKTVTRRLVKGDQVPRLCEGDSERPWVAVGQHDRRYGFVVTAATEDECAAQLGAFGACPYGRRGDRLWVRETFGLQVRRYGGGTGEHIVYRATNPDAIYCKSAEGREYPVKWKPSIHMPRHSSRILLEITDVRVERLQDITWEQALEEGIGDHRFECDRPVEPDGYPACSCGSVGYVDAFAALWNSTGGDWDANPWVWVVEFRRVQP